MLWESRGWLLEAWRTPRLEVDSLSHGHDTERRGSRLTHRYEDVFRARGLCFLVVKSIVARKTRWWASLRLLTRLSWQLRKSREGRHAKCSLRRHIWLKSLQTRQTAHTPTTPVVRSPRCSVDDCRPVHNTVSDERCRSRCLQCGRSRQTVHNTAAPSIVNTHALFGRAHADSTAGTAQCCRRR